MPVRTIVITLLTCALVGWVTMAPGASARQPTDATGPTAGVVPASVDVRNPTVASSPTLTGLSDQPGMRSVLGPFRRVTPFDYPSRPAESEQPPVAAPFRTVPSSTLPLAPAAGTPPSTVAGAAALSGELNLGVSFSGLDDTDSGYLPPDPQVAAGPNHLLEMVNGEGRIFNKTGSNLQNVSLHDFFGIPAGWGEGDPKVIYDALSGRWFASYLAFDNLSETRVYLAVSSSTDPTGSWCTSYISGSGLFPIADQPGIGVTNDKFTLSVNYFSFGSYAGEQTVVMQKSDWLSCANSIGIKVFDLRPAPWGTTRPAHSLSSANDQFLAEFDWASAREMCIDRITGSPNANNVNRATTCLPVANQNDPPAAAQFGGSGVIETGGNRPLDVIWRDGKLWVSASDACTWTGGAITSCIRLTQVDTATMTVGQDFLWGDPNGYLYFPAVILDGASNLYVVYSFSSSADHASTAVSGRLAGDTPNTLVSPALLKAGEVYYSATDTNGLVRWGDYLGAAVDPANPDCVWVVGEYAKNTGGSNWGTQIADVSFDGACPGQATPTPTNGSTPTPTHSAGQFIWGDVDCSGDIAPRDAQAILKNVLGQNALSQTQPCPAVGSQVTVDGVSQIWGDVDCGGDIAPRDAQAILKNVLGQNALSQTQPCPAVGSEVTLGASSSPTPAPTPSPTPTATSTQIPSSTATATPTPTPTPTPISTPTLTPTPSSTPTPTPTPSSTPTPHVTPSPTPAPGGFQLPHSSWYYDSLGTIWTVGEVVNDTGGTADFVKVTANFYSASNQLLATVYGYSCLNAIGPAGTSPYAVLLSSPPNGIDHVTVQVTGYYSPPLLYYPPPALDIHLSNSYTDGIGFVHAVGTVTNNSSNTYNFVKVCSAFYDSTGNVVREDFTYTSPDTLGMNAMGTFDSFVDGQGAGITNVKVWPDASYP